MTPSEFDQVGFCGTLWVTHDDVEKFVVSMIFPERLFGLLPAKPIPNTFSDSAWSKVEWVRCEDVERAFYKDPSEDFFMDAEEMPEFAFRELDLDNYATVVIDEEERFVYAHHEGSNLYAVVEELPTNGRLTDDGKEIDPLWYRAESLDELHFPKEYINPNQLDLFCRSNKGDQLAEVCNET